MKNKETELEKQVKALLEKNYANEILSTLIRYSEKVETGDMLAEMALELSCRGFVVFKPESIKEREKVIDLISADLSFNDSQEKLFI